MKQLGHAIGVLVLLIEREILPDGSPVGEVGDQADLCFGKPLMMQCGDLCEVSQIPGDGAFGVVGLPLNIGEGIHLEI